MALGKRSRAAKVLRAFRKPRRCRSAMRFLEKYGLREYGWSEHKLYDYEQGRTPLPPQLILDLIKVGALVEGSKWHVDFIEAMEHDALLEVELAQEKAARERVEIETDTSVEAEREVSAQPKPVHPPEKEAQPEPGALPPISKGDSRWQLAVLGIPLIVIAMVASCFVGYKIRD